MKLVDKNGTEVRVGDRLQFEDTIYNVTGIGEEPLSLKAIDFCKKCEIVGNIHDNPESLGGK